MNLRSVGRLIERAVKRAGLVDASGRRLVSVHGLRHTASAAAFAKGVPLVVISKQLRHKNTRVTAEVYEHLIADSQLDAFAAAAAQKENADWVGE
jgi:integrase